MGLLKIRFSILFGVWSRQYEKKGRRWAFHFFFLAIFFFSLLFWGLLHPHVKVPYQSLRANKHIRLVHKTDEAPKAPRLALLIFHLYRFQLEQNKIKNAVKSFVATGLLFAGKRKENRPQTQNRQQQAKQHTKKCIACGTVNGSEKHREEDRAQASCLFCGLRLRSCVVSVLSLLCWATQLRELDTSIFIYLFLLFLRSLFFSYLVDPLHFFFPCFIHWAAKMNLMILLCPYFLLFSFFFSTPFLLSLFPVSFSLSLCLSLSGCAFGLRKGNSPRATFVLDVSYSLSKEMHIK